MILAKRISWFAVASIGAFMIFSFGLSATAYAYSVYPAPAPAGSTAPSPSTAGFGSLTAPLDNFLQSINNIGATNPSVPENSFTPPTAPNGMVTTEIENNLQKFDTWLYGIAGFHILTVFVVILNVLSWLLGIVKGGVDWLIGLLR